MTKSNRYLFMLFYKSLSDKEKLFITYYLFRVVNNMNIEHSADTHYRYLLTKGVFKRYGK